MGMRHFRDNLLVQFAVVSFVVMAIIGGVLAVGSANLIQSQALEAMVAEAVGSALPRVLQVITPADLKVPMTGARYDGFDAFVQDSIVSKRTARVKLWAQDGTVIYSSDPAGVGLRFPEDENLQRALQEENAVMIKNPEAPENEYERHLGTLMEVYTPIIFPGETEPQGVLEIHQYYAPTAEKNSDFQRLLIGSIGVGFIGLYGASLSIVSGGWRTITRQRAALLESQVKLEARVEERTYEVGKANRELIVEIAERQWAEEQIQASLKEKELLLKEINHRVKNNLQLISSLLQHQSNYIKYEQALQVFRDSKDRIRSMALVHEKLYQSKDLARISFAYYVRSLTSSLFRSHGASSKVIKLKIHAQEIFLGIDTAIPCALIINELVSNSLVHAFPGDRDGEIKIDIRSEDGHLELMVSDNGVGFPKDLDLRTSETLGLELVSTLVDQLGGTIELGRGTSAGGAGASSAPGGRSGTSFKIEFTDLEISNASE